MAGVHGRRYGDPRERIIANTVCSEDLFEGEPCWLWMGARNGRGYGVLNEWDKARKKMRHRLVHRLAIMLWHGTPWHLIDNSMHRCNTKLCCNPRHLANGTNSENQLYYHATKAREPGEDDEEEMRMAA